MITETEMLIDGYTRTIRNAADDLTNFCMVNSENDIKRLKAAMEKLTKATARIEELYETMNKQEETEK